MRIFLRHPLKLAYVIARVKIFFSFNNAALDDCYVFSIES